MKNEGCVKCWHVLHRVDQHAPIAQRLPESPHLQNASLSLDVDRVRRSWGRGIAAVSSSKCLQLHSTISAFSSNESAVTPSLALYWACLITRSHTLAPMLRVSSESITTTWKAMDHLWVTRLPNDKSVLVCTSKRRLSSLYVPHLYWPPLLNKQHMDNFSWYIWCNWLT